MRASAASTSAETVEFEAKTRQAQLSGSIPSRSWSDLVVDHDLEREVGEAVVREQLPTPLECLDDVREPLTRDLGAILDERDPSQVARSFSRCRKRLCGEDEVVLWPFGRTSVTCHESCS